METRSVDGRVAALPQSDAEAETLMELAEAAREIEGLTAWTTCDGAGYGLDVGVTEGVMVFASDPAPQTSGLPLRLGATIVAALFAAGAIHYAR